jgi:hypothetical protein
MITAGKLGLQVLDPAPSTSIGGGAINNNFELLANALNYKGAWNSSIGYVVNDVVLYSDGSYYLAIMASTGQAPSSSPSDWSSLASGYVPYSGAAENVDLNSQSLLDVGLIEVGSGGQVQLNSNGSASFGSGALTVDTGGKLNLTATLPSNANTEGANFIITGNASTSGFYQSVLRLTLNAGYTSDQRSTTIEGNNNSAGTGANFLSINCGLYGGVDSTTAGYNAGLCNYAVNRGSGPAIGVVGSAFNGQGTGPKIGLVGYVDDTSGSSSARIGVMGLGGANLSPGVLPTSLTSACVFADNQTSGSPFFIASNNGSEVMRIASNGSLGVGITSPTALVHLNAGTALAGTAPLKLTPGTNLTTAEDGAFEYDGTHLYFTIGSTRHTII